ncbi:MAG: hypothetical protein AB1330_00990 [Bacillota bacterium]
MYLEWWRKDYDEVIISVDLVEVEENGQMEPQLQLNLSAGYKDPDWGFVEVDNLRLYFTADDAKHLYAELNALLKDPPARDDMSTVVKR